MILETENSLARLQERVNHLKADELIKRIKSRNQINKKELELELREYNPDKEVLSLIKEKANAIRLRRNYTSK